MDSIKAVVVLIVALVLIFAVIYAFQTYVMIPQPFKGLIMFLLICGAVLVVWHFLIDGLLLHAHF